MGMLTARFEAWQVMSGGATSNTTAAQGEPQDVRMIERYEGAHGKDSWPQHKVPAQCTRATNQSAGNPQKGSQSFWPQRIPINEEKLFGVCATSSSQPVLAAEVEGWMGIRRKGATISQQHLLAR